MTTPHAVNATRLAQILGVSKGRISQLVAEGKLQGTYSGDGRDRRFDALRAAEMLNVKIDPAQALGNGAASAASRRDLLASDAPADHRPTASAASPGDAGPDANARYQGARAQLAEMDALRQRRKLMQEAGTLVLVSEVDRITRAAMAAEIAQTEAMVRDAARLVADRFGINFLEVKTAMMEAYRAFRARRRDVLASTADEAAPSEAERGADEQIGTV